MAVLRRTAAAVAVAVTVVMSHKNWNLLTLCDLNLMGLLLCFEY